MNKTHYQTVILKLTSPKMRDIVIDIGAVFAFYTIVQFKKELDKACKAIWK
jgi:hypothetical protein